VFIFPSAAIFLTFCALANAADSFSGLVVSITDGDTIKVMRNGVAVAVRLNGIDCPEKKQAFGTRAKQLTGELVFSETVTVIEKGKDRYKRIIGEVALQGGRLLNHELLKAGMAWVYVKYCNDERYYKLEAKARKNRVGLWSERDPVAPWEFRKNRVTGSVR
jgi:micrococcal nuclease